MRAWSDATIARLNSDAVAPLYLVEIEFADGVFRATNAYINYNWNGHEWPGIGGAIRAIEFTERGESLTPISVSFNVSGAAKALTSALLRRDYQNRRLRMWKGFADVASGAMVQDDDLPYSYFGGYVSQMEWESQSEADGQGQIQIRLTANSVMAKWAAVPNNRYSSERQKDLFPNADDRSYDYVSRQGTIYP